MKTRDIINRERSRLMKAEQRLWDKRDKITELAIDRNGYNNGDREWIEEYAKAANIVRARADYLYHAAWFRAGLIDVLIGEQDSHHLLDTQRCAQGQL